MKIVPKTRFSCKTAKKRSKNGSKRVILTPFLTPFWPPFFDPSGGVFGPFFGVPRKVRKTGSKTPLFWTPFLLAGLTENGGPKIDHFWVKNGLRGVVRPVPPLGNAKNGPKFIAKCRRSNFSPFFTPRFLGGVFFWGPKWPHFGPHQKTTPQTPFLTTILMFFVESWWFFVILARFSRKTDQNDEKSSNFVKKQRNR